MIGRLVRRRGLLLYALEDDDGPSAQAAGVHGALGVGGPLGWVLGGDAQRYASVGGHFAQLIEPVGALEDSADCDLVDLDAAFGRAVVPAAHDGHRAAFAAIRDGGARAVVRGWGGS